MNFDSELDKISFVHGEADTEQMYGFIDNLKKLSNQREAIPSIFKFIEEHFDKYLGAPGPLVQFIEQEVDYIEELQTSIERKPTSLTVWMINRMLNGEVIAQREFWLSKLSGVSNHPDVDSETRKSAEEFIEFQRNKT